MSLRNSWISARQQRLAQTQQMLLAAQQQRLAKQSAMKTACQQAQQSRQQRLQERAAEVRQLQAEQQRHQQARHQQTQQRRQRIAEQSAQVQQQLQQMRDNRMAQAISEAAERADSRVERADMIQQFLNGLGILRGSQADTTRQTLQQFSGQLHQTTQQLLQSFSQQRQANTAQQQEELTAFASQLAEQVSRWLGSQQTSRADTQQAQQAERANFHQQLQTTVRENLQAWAEERQTSAASLQGSLQMFMSKLRQEVWGEAAASNGYHDSSVPLSAPEQLTPAPIDPVHPVIDLSAVDAMIAGVQEGISTGVIQSIFTGVDTFSLPENPVFPVVDSDWVRPEIPAGIPTDAGLSISAEPVIPPLELSAIHTQEVAIPPERAAAVVAEPETIREPIAPEPEILESTAVQPNPLISEPVAAVVPFAPMTSAIWDAPVVLPASPAQDPEALILEFVGGYVSKLQETQPELTLLQVISNRDLVRDLLAKGAVELGVDPSEILTVLRRMVSAASAVAV
ncbi:MAG: hypothetical protein NW237_05850 [Cyanobacteriota bacterium]|nr:hypothetical protein [Cyanobacteriota bacterium]